MLFLQDETSRTTLIYRLNDILYALDLRASRRKQKFIIFSLKKKKNKFNQR